MEKSQAYIIATAIVVAGLIVAAAVLGTQTGRYVRWESGQSLSILDTQTGDLLAVATTTEDINAGQWTKLVMLDP